MTSNILTNTKSIKSKSSDLFKECITDLSEASIGVIVVKTRETVRCMDIIQDWCNEQIEVDDIDQSLLEHAEVLPKGWDFKQWDILSGWCSYITSAEYVQRAANDEDIAHYSIPVERDGKANINEALKAIYEKHGYGADFDESVSESNGCGYAINLVHHFWENPAFIQHVRQFAREALHKPIRLFLVIPDWEDVPADLEDDVAIIALDTPTHNDLKAIWQKSLQSLDSNAYSHFTEKDVDVIAQNAAGMTEMEFENAIVLCHVRNADRLFATEPKIKKKIKKSKSLITVDDVLSALMQHKTEAVKRTDVLEYMPPATMDDVGGLENLKQWISVRKKAFGEDARKFGVEPPKGMLVVGPPGAGKSLVSKAVSSTLQVPCFKLDIGRVFGRYVGESEKRMRKALKTVEDASPCVLLVDEIDKGLGGVGGGGDSGTTSRVFGTLLTWLQERSNEESPIFIIMTANNVTGLPPELMRRGRLDEIFAVTFPNVNERAEILKIHCEKRGHKLSEADYKIIAKDYTDRFVGAELEAIVKDAIIEAFDEGAEKLEARHLIAQTSNIKPLAVAFADKVQAMTTWAENNARPASTEVKKKALPAGTTKRKLRSTRTMAG